MQWFKSSVVNPKLFIYLWKNLFWSYIRLQKASQNLEFVSFLQPFFHYNYLYMKWIGHYPK